jgi:glycosyltransferase involved in cell wall biosynthesis
VGASLAGRGWEGITAFAGEILTPELLDLGVQLGVGDRIVDIGEVDHMALNALYSGADALIFPSYSEGFGWPVIEAQAAGCPVVCANKTSLPELAGRAAFLFDPDDVDGMTNAVRSLDDVTSRATLRSEGFENVKRFSMQNFISGYEDVYRRAWEGQANA